MRDRLHSCKLTALDDDTLTRENCVSAYWCSGTVPDILVSNTSVFSTIRQSKSDTCKVVLIFGAVVGDVYADDIYVAKSGTVSGDVYANRLFCEGHIAGVAFVRDILIAGIRADDMRLSHTPPTMQFFNHDHKEQAYAKPLHLKLIR